MIRNFEEYWQRNQVMFDEANVSEQIVEKIWEDCTDIMEVNQLNKTIEALTERVKNLEPKTTKKTSEKKVI